jgi:tetratricopeptide (TPR) repeat protein
VRCLRNMPAAEVAEVSSDEEEDVRDKIKIGGLDDDPDDPVSQQVKAQNERSRAERAKIQEEFEAKLFVPERIDEARGYANSLFKADKLVEAVAAYERILPLCVGDEARQKKVVIYSNIAAVRVKQWRWKDALGLCSIVLETDPSHPKALYRRAQALRGLRDPHGSLQAINEARKLARKDDEGKPCGHVELDALEKHVQKDIRKLEAAAEEAKGVALRAARRKEEVRFGARASLACPVPGASTQAAVCHLAPTHGRALFWSAG